MSGQAVNGNTYMTGCPVPLTFPHLFTWAFPPLLQGLQSHGSAPLLATGKRDLKPACPPTARKEASLAHPEKQQLKYCLILALGRSDYKELPSQLIIKGLHEIYFDLPSIPSGSLLFFSELAKSFLLIASIVSGKNCFWVTSISFSRMLLICSHGAALPMAEFRSQTARNLCTANPSLTRQSHAVIILTSR